METLKKLQELLSWSVIRMEAETANRPDNNIHKPALIQTWCQIIRKLEEEIREYSRMPGA